MKKKKKIFALSDLHLDFTKEKDMQVFGEQWLDYENRIFKEWNIISNDDLLLIAGDISWAMHLEEAKKDLDRIEVMPGTKLMIKGNHDYWWSSINKIRSLDYKSIHFLQNDAIVFSDTRIAGTRGWLSPDDPNFTSADEKVFRRELIRLDLSLSYKLSKPYNKTIVMFHYPPFNRFGKPNEFEEILLKHEVDLVIYGHVHGNHYAPEGIFNNIKYVCSSADKLAFKPIEIEV